MQENVLEKVGKGLCGFAGSCESSFPFIPVL